MSSKIILFLEYPHNTYHSSVHNYIMVSLCGLYNGHDYFVRMMDFSTCCLSSVISTYWIKYSCPTSYNSMIYLTNGHIGLLNGEQQLTVL